MSDTPTPEEVLNQDYSYASEGDLPVKQKFSTTRKAGYVEEEVDVWVDQTINQATEFVDRYNSAAYAVSLLKAQYSALRETHESLEAKMAEKVEEAVKAYHTEAENQFNAHYRTLQEASTAKENELHVEIEQLKSNPSEPHNGEEVDAKVLSLEVALEEAHGQVRDLTTQLANAHEANPAVNAPSISVRAREIMERAATEAAEHVERALKAVAFVEEEAQAEADAILSKARDEAEKTRLQAFEDANAAIETKNAVVNERNEMFERLKMFFASQEENISEEIAAVNYTPYLTLEATPTEEEAHVDAETEVEVEAHVDAETEVSAELDSDKN